MLGATSLTNKHYSSHFATWFEGEHHNETAGTRCVCVCVCATVNVEKVIGTSNCHEFEMRYCNMVNKFRIYPRRRPQRGRSAVKKMLRNQANLRDKDNKAWAQMRRE